MYKLQVTQQAAIDGAWFERLRSLVVELGESYELLMPTLDGLEDDYDRFIQSGAVDIPNLYPYLVSTEVIRELRQEFEELQRKIRHREPNEIIRDLYVERIDDFITNIELVLAATAHDDKEYERLNRELYGKPNAKLFAAECQWVRHDIARFGKSGETVLDLVPDLQTTNSVLFPSPEVFHAVRSLHFTPGGYVDGLFGKALFDPSEIITQDKGDEIVRRAIVSAGSDYELGVSGLNLWSVSHQQKKVLRPKSYQQDAASFYGIVAHEVGSHLLEAANGERSALRLLQLGLAGYEKGNEGRALLREQIMLTSSEDYARQAWYPGKASWQYRVAIHMAICLAAGLYQGRQYSFAEIYQVLKALYTLWAEQYGDPATAFDAQILSRGAYNLAVRALKGTSGQGGAYYKDIVYIEGNVKAWKVAAQWPELIMYGDFGKFDIANTRHVTMIQELGIIPK